MRKILAILMRGILVVRGILVMMCLMTVSSYAIENLGTYGKVYQIEEEDILKYIKEHAKLPNFSKAYVWHKILQAAQINESLPVNKRDNVRYVKIIYTVPHNIVIAGHLIARKGERINVLKRIRLPRTYIVLADYMLPYFLNWSKRPNVVYLITQGNLFDLQKRYPNLTIYAGLPQVLTALHVRSIPDIVYQHEDELVILERGFPRWSKKR